MNTRSAVEKKGYPSPYLKNENSRSQNSGFDTVAWYVDRVSEEELLDSALASSVSMMSLSAGTPGNSPDGEGDKTTDGIRWCLDCDCAGLGLGSKERAGLLPTTCSELIEGDREDGEADGAGGVGGGFVGSQTNPGLTIKLTVSPSLTLYSLRSFASARAFPLRRSRCASAGGAEGCDAS